ncbi:MAG TPA: tetratricopeptide repeat protein [Gammaproteobacteria bacterium]|nr:tetratricopeptide repeat protein [Gammaproteobacteria bacterium]
MSKPFVDLVLLQQRLRTAVSGALLLTLAACGSSTPRQADVPPPREVVAPAAPVAVGRSQSDSRRERRAAEQDTETGRAAPVAAEPERRERRGERRAAEEAAEAAASGVVEPVPEVAAAAYQRALSAMLAENWLEAELELEQLALEQPSYPGPHVNLALVYLHDGRRDDARAALDRALELEPGHAQANTQLGIMLREDGKFVEAEAAYRRALATDPEHALAHYNLGVLLDIYLRRTAEALEHYEHYQSSLAQPNETVARWIIDLRRRVGNGEAARVARAGGQ